MGKSYEPCVANTHNALSRVVDEAALIAALDAGAIAGAALDCA